MSKIDMGRKLWIFTSRFAAQTQEILQQGRSAAQLILIAKADKSKLEISLKDWVSKHSPLKAKINFQLVCKTNRFKTRTPAALKMHFSLTIQ